MPTPATPSASSDAPSRCLQKICAKGKSVPKEDREFLPLGNVASSCVKELGVAGNHCIYSGKGKNPEGLDLDANAGKDCSSMHLKISTNHESSQGSEQQTQIKRRGSITEPSGKGFGLSSWQRDPIILKEPIQESGRSPELMGLTSENLFWELSEFGTAATEDGSPEESDYYYTTPGVRNRWSNCISEFDDAFALMTPSTTTTTTTDGNRAMCGPISHDQTFDELSASGFAPQTLSPASQCPMLQHHQHMGQYGNQSPGPGPAIVFASSPGSDESCIVPSSPAITNLNTSCQCIPRALSILEDLELTSFQPQNKAIAPDHTLKCLRWCLQRCTKILDCKLLKWTSEFLVLLTVISRIMLDIFDRLDSEAAAAAHQPLHKWSFFPPHPPPPPPPLCSSSLGKYDFESSPQEIQCLMNWLVLIQTKKLAAFLDRLKRKLLFTEEHDWAERYHGLLGLLEQRCLQLVRRLSK